MYVLGLIGDIASFGDKVTKGVIDVFNFALQIVEFLPNLLNVIPNPFGAIIKIFIPIMLSLFLWKLYKGGGS